MKTKMKTLMTLILVLVVSTSSAQSIKDLRLKNDKIMQLVFTNDISSAKISRPDIINISVEKNVAYLMPVLDFENSCNLTIITDSLYYEFNVNYDSLASQFTYLITEDEATFNIKYKGSLKRDIVASTPVPTIAVPKHSSEFTSIIRSGGYLFNNNVVVNDVYLSLNGIYTREEFIYMSVTIDNDSDIDYDLENFTFLISAKEKKTITTDEFNQVQILGQSRKPAVIAKKSSAKIVFALQKFNLNKDKVLTIDMIEKNGERNITLTVKPHTIAKSQSVKHEN